MAPVALHRRSSPRGGPAALTPELEILHGDDALLPQFAGNYHELLCFRSDGASCRIGEHTYRVQAGDVFVLDRTNPGASVQPDPTTADRPSAVRVVFSTSLFQAPWFPPELAVERLFTRKPSRPERRVPLSAAERDELDFALSRLLEAYQGSDPARTPICIGYLSAIVGIVRRATLRKNDPQPIHGATAELVHAMAQYIDHNARQRLTLTGLAERAGVTPTYFSAAFHRVMGVPLMSYVNARRLESAKLLLRTTELKVSAVCLEAGFNDLSHFNRLFKGQVGATPLRYRRMHRVAPAVPAVQISRSA